MAQIVDYDTMRQMVIKAWADMPNADNDPVVESCKRNADLLADIAVRVDRERHRSDHDPEVTLQFIMAIAANASINIIHDFRSSAEDVVSTADVQHGIVHSTLDSLSLYLHDGIGVSDHDMAKPFKAGDLPMKDVPDA